MATETTTTMTKTAARPPLVWLLAAFAAVYLIWGSTYLAIRYAIETLPPFLMAAARFLAAGGVLYAWVRLRGTPAPTRVHWRSALIVGALLLLVGNGAVVWAEHRVSSGVAALLVAVEPIWIVLLAWLRPGGTRPAARTWAGVALGLAGLVLLVGPADLAGGRVDALGAGLVLVGTLGWAAGSLYGQRAPFPASPFLATAMQMLAGGALMLLAGLVTGEAGRLDPSAWSARSLGALLYLAVFGSLVAFTAYVWLLRVESPSRVATYAYVNPLVAVLLGWAVAGEPLTPRVLAAAAVIVGAVVLITTAGGEDRGAKAGEGAKTRERAKVREYESTEGRATA